MAALLYASISCLARHLSSPLSCTQAKPPVVPAKHVHEHVADMQAELKRHLTALSASVTLPDARPEPAPTVTSTPAMTEQEMLERLYTEAPVSPDFTNCPKCERNHDDQPMLLDCLHSHCGSCVEDTKAEARETGADEDTTKCGSCGLTSDTDRGLRDYVSYRESKANRLRRSAGIVVTTV